MYSDASDVSRYRLHQSGGYILDPNNQPVFITGQCAWPLFTQPTFADAKLLIDSRADHGYNALLVALFDHTFANSAPNTNAGIDPFSTPEDLTTLQSDYLDYCKTVVVYGRARGIVFFCAPSYLGFNGGVEGWESAINNTSSANLISVYTTVGAAFRSVPNVVWVMGGDRDPGASVKSKVSDIVTGLRAGGSQHLITAHGNRNTTSRGIYPSVTWLGLNAVYTDSTPAAVTATGYALSPFMPQFLIEDYYANEHGVTNLGVRNEGYWAWLSGCNCGQFTGENPTQGMGCTYFNSGFPDVPDRDWKVQLDSTSCNDRARLGRIARSRRHWLLVPDAAHAVVTAGFSSGANLVTTARASDASSVFAYCPTGSAVTITVDMTKIGGSTAKAWWVSPRADTQTFINSFGTTGTQNFTPPDSNDWLLLLDNAAVFGAGPF